MYRTSDLHLAKEFDACELNLHYFEPDSLVYTFAFGFQTGQSRELQGHYFVVPCSLDPLANPWSWLWHCWYLGCPTQGNPTLKRVLI